MIAAGLERWRSLGVPFPWSEPADSWRRARAAQRRTSVGLRGSTWGRGVDTPAGSSYTARQLAGPLADWVVELGFTHVELLPVTHHPFAGGSWGYQVRRLLRPDARLGSPDDLRHLMIDTCHDHLGVIVDWVPAHFPATSSPWPASTAPLYEHADPDGVSTPDWGRWCSTTVGSRSGTSWWPTPLLVGGVPSPVCGSMRWPRCCTRLLLRRAGEWLPNEHGGREGPRRLAFVRELTDVVHDENPGALVVAEESTSWPG